MRRINISLALLACLSLSLSVAAPASSTDLVKELQQDAPADAPAYDPNVPLPGEDDLTWDQASDIPEGEAYFELEPSVQPTIQPFGGSSSVATRCSVDTSYVYKRKSGKDFPHGGVGGKPKTTCPVNMVSIRHATNMYKEVWWGWQKVGKTWSASNAGVKTLTQKNVMVKCADLRMTKFRIVVTSRATLPNGKSGGASAYEEGRQPCGTNP